MEPDIRILASGGNACVLTVQGKRKKTAVRISQETDTTEIEVAMHDKLWKRFAPYVVHILVAEIDNHIPPKYLAIMKQHALCNNLVEHWIKTGVESYSIIETEFATLGSLSKYSKRTDPEVVRKVCFDVMCFLYLAEAEYGFSHNDLTSNNIVLTVVGPDNMLLAQVIDFDYARFNEQSMVGTAPGTLGSPYILPQEVLDIPGRASYVGAIDLWSLGITMLGCLLDHTYFLHDEDARVISKRIDCLQSYLGNSNEDPPAEEHKYMKQFKERIQGWDAVTLDFYRILLNPEPLTRIQNGEFYKLLQSSPYFDSIAKRQQMLTALVKNRLTGGEFVNTLKTVKQQLERAITDGFVVRESLKCVHCKKKDALYLCSRYGFVVCSLECKVAHIRI